MNNTKRFAALLAAFGISLPARAEKVIKSGRRLGHGLSWNPLSKDDYYVDYHGTIHRRQAKRDKSMSARQWKLLRKRNRKAAEQECSTQAQ